MNSKLYVGQVRHRRFAPHEHAFSYKMFMMYLDLDELPGLFDRFLLWSARRFNIAYFRRSDHLGEASSSLKQSVVDLVYEKTGTRLDGPVHLLTHLRYFGHGFNPVSFYYCFDKHYNRVEVIVAEVNNTPWGEQFCYVLPVTSAARSNNVLRFDLKKQFHVSPFNPMDQDYSWYFTLHDQRLGVHMENRVHGEKVFDATLSLRASEISSRNLGRALVQFPLMTVKVMFSIYYQALKLWLKRTPLYTHPDIIIKDNARADEVKS